MKMLLLLIVLGFLGYQLHTMMLIDLWASQTGIIQPFDYPLGPNDFPVQMHEYDFFDDFATKTPKKQISEIITKTDSWENVNITNHYVWYSVTIPKQYKYSEEYTDRRPLLIGNGPGTQQVVELHINSQAEYRQPKILMQLKTVASNGTYEKLIPLDPDYKSLENYEHNGFHWWLYGYNKWFASAYGPIVDWWYSTLISMKIEADVTDANAVSDLKKVIDTFEQRNSDTPARSDA